MDLDEILTAFRAPGEKLQQAVIARLASSPREALEHLKSLVGTGQSASVERWAVEALGMILLPPAVPLILAALSSPHMSVRLHAVRAIWRRGDASLAKHLRPLLADPSGGVRMNALQALTALAPRWLKAAARESANDPKAYVRKLAGKLLGG